MNILDRLALAASALFKKDPIYGIGFKASQVTGYADVKEPETKYENLVKYGWRRNELIYAAVSKKANTASQVKLEVVSNGEPIDNHPVRRLLERPNPEMTEFEFWSSIVIFQDFAGAAYFERVRSAAGLTVELWPMRPDWVKPVISKADGSLLGYLYGPPGEVPVRLAPEDVLCFKLFDPLNKYGAYPPVATAARVGDLDNATTDYVRLLFQEGGVPPGILTSKQSINEATARVIREMYQSQYGGYTNWIAPMVLGYDTTYSKTGLGIQEMGMDILDRRAEIRICMTLRVPPALIGAHVGLERAIQNNMREFQRDWWNNDLIPLYKSFRDVIAENILSEYGDTGVDLEWNFAEVPALQEDQNEVLKLNLEAFKAGAITRNQFNEAWGLDDLGPAGDMYLLSGFVMEVPAGEATAPDKDTFDEPEPEDEGKQFKSIVPDDIRAKHEDAITGTATQFFAQELVRIAEKIKDEYQHRELSREISQNYEAKQFPIDPVFWNSERQRLIEILFPLMSAAAVDAQFLAYNQLATLADIGVGWDVIHEGAIAWAQQHTVTVVGQITTTSMNAFVQNFGPWVESGEPLSELIKSLEPYYGPVRARMIGVTETTRAFAGANNDFWKSSGLVDKWRYITAVDDRVCPICLPKHLQEYDFNDQMDLPPQHVNCRCGTQPVVNI
ncbi:MAG: phage portal protein [bacterium]